MATIHDWAYFYVVGSKFRSIQTTYDYITQAIEWMPTFLVIVSASLYVSRPFREFVIRGGNIGLSGLGFHRWYRRQLFTGIVGAGVIIIPSLTFAVMEPYPSNLVYLCISFLCLASAVSSIYINHVFRHFVLFNLGALALAVFTWGVMEGVLDSVGSITTGSSVHRLQLRGDSTEKQILLLRIFEKGLLIRNSSNDRIEFIRWDQVEVLSRRASSGLQPVGCSWLGLFCRAAVTP